MLQVQLLLSILTIYFLVVKPLILDRGIPKHIKEEIIRLVKQEVKLNLMNKEIHIQSKELTKLKHSISYIIKNKVTYLNNYKGINEYIDSIVYDELINSVDNNQETFFKVKYIKLKKDFDNLKKNLTDKLKFYENKITELQNQNFNLRDNINTLKHTNYDEVVRILDNMFNRFIDDIFYFEIERKWACKNPEKPTENHYRMPNLEKKAEHKEKLYDLLKTSFSKDFIARLEVYFSKSYLETYLVEKISTLYEARYVQAANESAALSKVVRDNLEEISLRNKEKEKERTLEKNKRINKIVGTFNHSKLLPETEEELKTKPTGTRTYQFLKNKYTLNRTKYDELRKTITDESDIYRDVDKYEFADDKMLAMLADELEWTKEVLTPEKIEQAKINLVDIALKQPPAKKFNPFDLMAPQFRNYPKDKVEWGGVIHDLSDKRLNPVLYDKRLYTPESKISNIQEALEIKGVASITM